MRYVAALIFCFVIGCTGGTDARVETNDQPVLETYHGIANNNGDFHVDVGDSPPMVQVWCTDLAGSRRVVSFDYEDGTIMAMCEPGGKVEVSVIR